MSDSLGNHPDSEGVEPVPEGDAYIVSTPCCAARVFLPIDEAVPGGKLDVVCPLCGKGWLVELVAGHVEGQWRPVWTEATQP
ncbi:MAG: hypothetical protein ACRDZO_25330 [Egibacteraceae bacterium]